MYVDNVESERAELQSAYDQATQQLSLKALRLKRSQLGDRELSFLQNFIPQNLHSGYFVYNLGQMANQNRLSLRTLQYTVVNSDLASGNSEKKLMVEFTMDGSYGDFMNWLRQVETSDVLIDVESVRGAKISNNSDVITFYVKLYAYGMDIN